MKAYGLFYVLSEHMSCPGHVSKILYILGAFECPNFPKNQNFPSFSSQALGNLLYVSPSSFARPICGLLVGLAAFLSNAHQFSGLKSKFGETEMSALYQSFR